MKGVKAMNPISWLQISDLHIFSQDPSWKNFNKHLQEYLSDHRKPDFVVITGDYRNIWANEEFGNAERFIRELMIQLNLNLSTDLFLIPGNHDLQPQKKKQVITKSFLRKNTIQVDDDPRTHEMQKLLPPGLTPWDRGANTTSWLSKHEHEPTNYLDRLCGVRRHNAEDENIVDFDPLVRGFSEYTSFVKNVISWYGESSVPPAVPHVRKWENNDLGFNIVHLNTALVADGGRCHYHAMDLSSTIDVLNNIRTGLPTIILAHNSFYDLHPDIQNHLISPLSHANTCVWLCGDAHRFKSSESISRPSDDCREPIPIFTCGKSAPDHQDNYSDNGFILYEYDGTQITAQHIKWSLLSSSKIAESRIAIDLSQNHSGIHEKSTKRRMMIGYLSCNPSAAFERKYHLGHAYFIKKIDDIISSRDYAFIMTSSFLFPHNRSRDSHRSDQRYANRMIEMWRECFDGRVEVLDIKDYFHQPIPLDDQASRLSTYVSRMELQMEVNGRCNDIIYDWFHTGHIEDDDYKYLKDCFEVSHRSSVVQNELLSFVYLLHKRPVWYSNPWLVSFIDFWNRSIYFLIQDRLRIDVSANDIYIIEAARNHYVWDAISYCAKRFSYGNFPQVEYFDNLLDIDCHLPMKSSNSQKAFFLADYHQRIELPDEFKAHVKQRFNTTKDPNAVAEEYYQRLFKV